MQHCMGDYVLVTYSKGRLSKSDSYLEEFGLESSEGASNTKVKFLASIYRHGLILVRFHQVAECTLDVCICDSAELGTEYGLSTK